MNRRGTAVLAVLVVLAAGALAGTIALLSARVAADSAEATALRTQSRLTLRSGVLAVAAEAALQRESVLAGGDFAFDPPAELFREGNVAGVFRVAGGGLTPLDARLDVNTATPEMLALLPGIDAALAAEIAGVLPVESLAGLLAAEGVTPTLLYGSESDDPTEAMPDVPLAALLTVGSVDPHLAIGVGDIDTATERIRLDLEPDEQMREKIAELYSDEVAEFVIAMLRQLPGTRNSRSEFLGVLNQTGMDLRDGGAWMDGACFSATPGAGRVDINRASFEVLAALPGVGEERAAAIVDARGGLAAADLADPLWPYKEGLVDEEAMIGSIDRFTTRSVRWVLRLEAGTLLDDDRGVGIDSLADARRARAGDREDAGRLRDRVAMDLLVDFSGPTPVVVPLGDVTIADEVAQLGRLLGTAPEQDPADSKEPDEPDDTDAPAEDPASPTRGETPAPGEAMDGDESGSEGP
ncbi:MAG: hypothetical protein AAFX79_06390 [Planctomycetota bacterium]